MWARSRVRLRTQPIPQWCISSSKAIISKPPQTVSPTGHQGFKCPSLWETIVIEMTTISKPHLMQSWQHFLEGKWRQIPSPASNDGDHLASFMFSLVCCDLLWAWHIGLSFRWLQDGGMASGTEEFNSRTIAAYNLVLSGVLLWTRQPHWCCSPPQVTLRPRTTTCSIAWSAARLTQRPTCWWHRCICLKKKSSCVLRPWSFVWAIILT